MKNYTISIDHDLKLIRYRHTGIINAEEIEAAWFEFLSIKEFTEQKYNLLSNYLGSKFDFPIHSADEIVKFMQNIQHIVKGKKQALIVDDNFSVAASMLFETKVQKQVGFIVRIFNTESAALKWLT